MSEITKLKARELSADTYIPYVRHADTHTVALKSRSLMTMIALDGISFETADIRDINALHRDLNTLWRNIGDERLALWSHVIRRRSNDYPDGAFSNAFAAKLDAKYRARMTGEELFQNDLYLTLVWSPSLDVPDKLGTLVKRLRKVRRERIELDAESHKKLHDATQDTIAGLGRYNPRLLGLYEHDGIVFSELSEVLHRLIGGRPERLPLTDGPISSAIYSDRVIIGRETVEIRYEGTSRFAGLFGFKEYPARTRPGMLDGVLTLPFELVVSQSFGFMSLSLIHI